MNSPPETPRTEGASLQPSPREPSISTAMYKPLAFYPNKKARVEDQGPVPSRQSHTVAHTSPSSAYLALERHHHSQSSAFDRSDDDTHHNRRHSMHPSYGSAHYRSERHDSHRPYSRGQSSWSKGYASEPSWDAINRHGSSRERVPISPSSEFAFGPDGSLPTRSFAGSERGPRPSSSHHLARQGCSMRPASSSTRDGYTSRELQRSPAGYDVYERRSYENERGYARRDSCDAECRDGCSQSSIFMPAHYDYTQSKTRKRSNLPKQSTEIMKTWFDNVCLP